jgi:hypothetical protein
MSNSNYSLCLIPLIDIGHEIKLKEFINSYVKPATKLSVDAIKDYVEDNLSNFSKDYIELIKFLGEKTGIVNEKLVKVYERFGKLIIEEKIIASSNISDAIKSKLQDIIMTDMENQLYIIRRLGLDDLTLTDIIRSSDELYRSLNLLDGYLKRIESSLNDLINLSMHINYYLLIILYRIDEGILEDVDKLIELLADYVEEKDTIIETLDIELTEERRVYIKKFLE